MVGKQSKQSKHEKIQFFTDIRAGDDREQGTELTRLHYNLRQNILCLFWSAYKAYLQICRPPTDKSASQQDGAWSRIVISKSAIWILARMSSFKQSAESVTEFPLL